MPGRGRWISMTPTSQVLAGLAWWPPDGLANPTDVLLGSNPAPQPGGSPPPLTTPPNLSRCPLTLAERNKKPEDEGTWVARSRGSAPELRAEWRRGGGGSGHADRSPHHTAAGQMPAGRWRS